ncbi:MAG: hypothetical protein AAF385_09500 [Pseudomonadota bacterium]
MLIAAAALVVFIGLVHSILGERFILLRLFRQPLPPLFGSDDFTKKTLRFAWHITTLAWFGLAAIIVHISEASADRAVILTIIGLTFGASALVALLASRGKHYSWLVFGVIAVLCFLAAS